MLNMWNLSNPIRAKQSQTSIEVSRLNLTYSADDPNNPEDRLGVSEIRNRISRPHSCMSDREAQVALAQRKRARRARRLFVSHMQSFPRTGTCQIKWLPNCEPITRPEHYQSRISLVSHGTTVVSRTMFERLWPILNTITTLPSA